VNVFPDVLEELLTMIVEEEGPKYMLILQGSGTNSAFSRCISCMTSWIKSGLAQVVLSHGNLPFLTLHHFIYSCKGILKEMFSFNHSQPLCRKLLGCCGLLRL
jgi:hypothetical protein